MPTWTGPEPSAITAWSIVQAGHAVGRRFWTALAEVGLTPIEFGVLLRLDLDPGMSNAALARAVLVTPQSMSDVLTRLEGEGLVRRAAAGRGRPTVTTLTAKGRRRLTRCEKVVARVEEGLGLSPRKAAELNKVLLGLC